MGKQNDLLIEARSNGNWVTRATNLALETALVGLCVEFNPAETEQIRSDDVRLVNIRNAMEEVLEETCVVAEQDLPAWVLDEYENAKSAGGNTDATGLRWSTVNRRYERTAADVGTVEWRGPRFKARPPEPREGERYDYEGHPIRPTAISLMVLREMSIKLERATLTERLDLILKSTRVEARIEAGKNTHVTVVVAEAEQQGASIVQAAESVITHNSIVPSAQRKRRDDLSPAIDRARDMARDRNDPAEVWTILVEAAKSVKPPPPLLGFAENEVKHGDAAEPSFLSRNAFSKRFGRILKRDFRTDAS